MNDRLNTDMVVAAEDLPPLARPPNHGPAELCVSQLCDLRRWKASPVLFYLYAPFGAVLLVLRLALLASAGLLAWALPRCAKPGWFRLVRASLGIRVSLNRPRAEIAALTDGCVVPSNHLTLLDVLTIMDLPGATVMVGDPGKRSNFLHKAVVYLSFHISGARYVTTLGMRDLARFQAKWRQRRQGTTLYTTPELTIGNGCGLFRFHAGMLGRGAPVVPVAGRVATCFGMAPHPLLDGSLAIMMRLLMMPSLVFRLDFLDPMRRLPGEEAQDFADRVQQAVAGHLGIPATHWNHEDKHAFRKTVRAIGP